MGLLPFGLKWDSLPYVVCLQVYIIDMRWGHKIVISTITINGRFKYEYLKQMNENFDFEQQF